ncbi:MAG: DUF2804 domain-containing protein [Bacilli bacterium]|nr:DUF2804 domain-containing protein [Bacilli bacterium]
MQHELSEGLLLNKEGNLMEAGYAFSLVKKYDRSMIKGMKWRIKEWDYYYIGNKHCGIALTIADNSYMSMGSVSFLNFDEKKETTNSLMKWFTFGKLNLPSTSKEGDVFFEYKNLKMSFKHENGKRHINVYFNEFMKGKNLRADLYLDETNQNSMVIATPFKKDKHFYYNQKINMLKSSGYVKIGDQVFDFNDETWGVLDWGRGVWTYSNTWLWSSLSGKYNGHRIGFNLGYGFGDTSAASENMFFYDDKAYKFEDVRFDIPIDKYGNDSYLEPWFFRSSTGDINLKFTPIIDRKANLNAVIIKSNQHQVFGTFTGYVLIDGKEIYFEDMPGFAEKVHNAW